LALSTVFGNSEPRHAVPVRDYRRKPKPGGSWQFLNRSMCSDLRDYDEPLGRRPSDNAKTNRKGFACLLGALLHVSGWIQVRDAPEGQQCRPRTIAMGAPDLEQGNVVIDLGIVEQPFAGCETAALLKNLQVPDMIARRNP
jgi:hypothetical protein